jgi:hypothetical protein
MKKFIGLLTITIMIGLVVTGCAPQQSEETAAKPTAVAKEEPTKAAEKAPEPTATPVPEEKPGDVAQGPADSWDGWYVDKAEWVGAQTEFEFSTDKNVLPGATALKAISTFADDRVRDLYIGRLETGLEAGKTYKISFDIRFDSAFLTTDFPDEDPYVPYQNVETLNYIQYQVKDGNQRNHEAFAAIEDYPEQKVEATKYVDEAMLGDGNFHKITVEHTAKETSATLMLIIRFRADEVDVNDFYIANFKCE